MPGKRKSREEEGEGQLTVAGEQRPAKALKHGTSYSEKLREALDHIRDNRVSIREASRTFGIPKSTLHAKLTGKRPALESKMGPDTYLTIEEENLVKTWILNKAKLGFPLARKDVKDSIQRVLQQCPRPTPFVNQRPGNKWMSLHLKRHPEIEIKNSETISKARAVVTRETIECWFRDLKEFLKQKNCEDIFRDGKRVLNCDETGCLTCPKTGKVLGPKGYKNLYEISCGKEKESITVLCTYNANGDALPPMVVFPYKRTPNVIMKSLPPGWSLGKSDSGWMVSSVFYEYISKVLFQYLQDSKVTFPVILFLDGHKSHLSLQLSNFCAENQIIIYCLPSNATHIVQPCDVSVFRPLKVAWRKIVRKARQVKLVINRANFVPMFKKAYDEVRRETIQNGFRACGLFPLNEMAIDYSKCIPERRAELDRDETDLQEDEEEQPTAEDLKTTKKVIEYFLKQNGQEMLLFPHLREGTCPEGEYKQLCLLWKKCVQSIASNPSLEPEGANEPECDSSSTQHLPPPEHELGDIHPEESQRREDQDIMRMPIIMSEGDNIAEDDINLSGSLFDFIDCAPININIDLGDIVNDSTTNVPTDCAPINGETEGEDVAHESTAYVTVIDTTAIEVPFQPDSGAVHLFDSELLVFKPKKTPQISSSWDEETARLNSVWSQELSLPDAESAKPLKSDKPHVKRHYCITEKEWREEQEMKEKDKRESEKIKAEKAKQRADKKAETERLKQEKLQTKKGRPKRQRTSEKAEQEAGQSTAQQEESSTKLQGGSSAGPPAGSSTEEHRCPSCNGLYEEPPTEDWIECKGCKLWYHEDCTLYLGRGDFYCYNCEV